MQDSWGVLQLAASNIPLRSFVHTSGNEAAGTMYQCGAKIFLTDDAVATRLDWIATKTCLCSVALQRPVDVRKNN